MPYCSIRSIHATANLPYGNDPQILPAIGLMLLGGAAVVLLEKFGNGE